MKQNIKLTNGEASKGFNSIAAQDNFNPDIQIHAHTSPIYTTSTFIYESPEKAKEIFGRTAEGYAYSRFGHPNAILVEEKMEQLETFGLGIEAKALVFNSGMTALANLFQ